MIKWTFQIADFAVLVDHGENQRKRKERQVLRPCQRTPPQSKKKPQTNKKL